MTTLQEEWRPVVGYEGIYEVSSLGRVRRVGRANGANKIGVPLKLQYGWAGYPHLILNNRGKRLIPVHRMVAEAFLGPCPEGHEVHHLDHDRKNARVDNLVYLSQAEHAAAHTGQERPNHPRGERATHAKLTAAEVRAIRRDYHKFTKPELARRYGVHSSTIWKIKARRLWSHLD